jgi:hypothetical protein
MPINTTPTEVSATLVTNQTVTADKLHIKQLIIDDPSYVKPTIQLKLVPYGTLSDGSNAFSEEVISLNTRDAYAAIANLQAKGMNKMAAALQALFDATSELVDFMADRLVQHEQALADQKTAMDAFREAQQDGKTGADLQPILDTYQAAQERVKVTSMAVADAANPL